jgi:hypothetical protein
VLTPAEQHLLQSLSAQEREAFLGKTPEEQARILDVVAGPPDYTQDPVGYCRNVLQVTLTQAQEQIARACLEHPYKVLVNSAQSVGKTFLAAALVNWFFDTFDPSVIITSAPSEKHVISVLWGEIRRQRSRAGLASHFTGPRGAEMMSAPNHWARGFTVSKSESFPGEHHEKMMFVFDEAEGVDSAYWETARTMFKPQEGHIWLTIANPTTTSSQNYIESQQAGSDGKPSWRQFSMSALDHPNIKAQLEGKPPVIPEAVTLTQLDGWIADGCDPVRAAEKLATDFEWRPDSGNWWRAGAIAEARIFGRRPSSDSSGVWSEALWDAVTKRRDLPFPRDEFPEIGADMSTGKGNDFWAACCRWGPLALRHETSNVFDAVRIFGRLKELAGDMAWHVSRVYPQLADVDPKRIRIKLDDDGTGNAVFAMLQAEGYNAIAVGAARLADAQSRYPNKRSELWFQTAEKAKKGLVCLSKLDGATLARMRLQALAVEWTVDSTGRRVVERKEKTRDKLGRSPDDLDALNLAFLTYLDAYPKPTPRDEEEEALPANAFGEYAYRPSNAERRGLRGLGRGAYSRCEEKGLFGRGRGPYSSY